MAKTFLGYKNMENEENVITGYPWVHEDGKLDSLRENVKYTER